MSATTLTAPGRVNTAGGMITFALVPVRSRILGAKLVASILLALTMLVMSVAIVAAAVFVASPGIDGTWSDAAPLIAQSAVFLTTGMVVGVAFGAIWMLLPLLIGISRITRREIAG